MMYEVDEQHPIKLIVSYRHKIVNVGAIFTVIIFLARRDLFFGNVFGAIVLGSDTRG